jgi:hypothetical protein
MPVLSLSGGTTAQLLAWGSGAMLLLSVLPALKHFASLGTWCLGAFVAGSLSTWWVLAEQLRAAPVDSVQAALGGVGWALFAVSAQSDAIAIEPERSAALPVAQRHRRSRPPVLDALFLALVVGGGVPAFLAWRVDRTAHAVLAQLIACAAALAALSLAGVAVDTLALERWSTGSRARLAESWPTLALLALLLVVGLVLKLF